MLRHVIAADQAQEFGAGERKRRAPRFERDEQICAQGQLSEQEAQAIVVKVVQKQIAQKSCLTDLCSAQPFESVGGHDVRLPAKLVKFCECPWLDQVNTIQKDHFERPRLRCNGAGESKQEGSIASSEFHDRVHPPVRITSAPRFHQQRDVAHQSIEPPQIFPRGERAGVLRRQFVEPFRLRLTADRRPERTRFWLNPDHATIYSTSNNAPWQLKPAPKEETHQGPPGAPLVNALFRTCKINGLLMLPNSRNVSALQQRSDSLNSS